MSRSLWVTTTHDWAAGVDLKHVEKVRSKPEEFAPSGVLHLVMEVLAYAADEAESTGGGNATVTLHTDGSVRVADDGRGTDTRRDPDGVVVKKPVMVSPDLRFFDDGTAQTLADGHSRRGISVVAALSSWLVHENRRLDGAWQQRYEHGVPVTDLDPLTPNGSTGIAVHFLPMPSIQQLPKDAAALLHKSSTPDLQVRVLDQRT